MCNKTLTLGSLFDGLGGWQIAAVKANVEPLWSSEIEKFPLALTKIRFPDTEQLGDITKIDGSQIEPVDILTMGSPCTQLSISGSRKGLAGDESGLFREGIRIAREMRKATNGLYPRYLVWENVPGAFSTNKGADFRAVLEEITEAEIPMPRSGKWATAGLVRSSKCTVGWRTLDAQYWGVAQRRRRIFLVASYCDGRDGIIEEILFKPESLSRNPAPSQDEGENIAGRPNESIGIASHDPWCIAGNIIGRSNKNGGNQMGVQEGKCYTLTAMDRHAVVYDMTHANDVIREVSGVAPTLQARMGTGGNQVPLVLNDQGGESMGISYGVTATLRASEHGHQPVIVQADSFSSFSDTGVASSLKASGGVLGGGSENLVARNDEVCPVVRKLTPLECERLQGLPDNWTLINDKSCSDSARYKAIGNGMAQPCADFIIARIAEAERKYGGN